MKLLAAGLISLVAVSAAAAAATGRPKEAVVPAVQAKAKAINIKLSDLPKAPRKLKPASKGQSDPKCSYYDPDQSDLTVNGKASSPEFTVEDGSFLTSSTSIFKTAAQGRTAYARVVKPQLPRCFAEIISKSLTAGHVEILSSGPKPFPKLAERSNAYRVVADYTIPKNKVRLYFDIVLMNRAKADVFIFFFAIKTPFKEAFVRGVAGKVAARTTIA